MVAKRLIVHLGLAKTGTTVLQQCFHDNRQHLLDEHSILYPADGPNHFHFQSAVSDAPELLIQIRREGLTTREEAKARAAKFLADFEAELKSCNAQTVLISSEFFSSMAQSEFQRFYELLSGYAEEIWAVLYMRDPWSFSQSLMQQFVRDGRFGAPLKYGYCSGQVETIRTCESIFGERLVVRPYFGGGPQRTDIISDFCEAIGIPGLPASSAEDPAANKSIGHITMTLIAELNSAWPQFDQNGVYVHSIERDAALNWILNLPLKDRPLILTKRQVAVIQTMAKDDMDYVERRHFSGERLFTDYMVNEDPPDRDHTMSLETLTEDDLRKITRAMLEAQVRKQKAKT